ncbi:hypothetical protein FRC15_002392 [Serendipita sp. 397]|nr:hypothetical protein FRC15_002392 [Serendipita sp. 397]
MEFLDLPNEIIEVVLVYTLLASDIVSCSQACRRIYNIVKHSSELQLIVELAIEGLRLRRFPPTLQPCGMKTKSATELLLQFKQSQEAWVSQRPVRSRSHSNVRSPNQRVRDGLLAFIFPNSSTSNRTHGIEIQSLWIEENQQEPRIWKRHEDLGISVMTFLFDPSQDLLVLVETNRPHHFAGEKATQIHLRSLSSGLNHPQAKVPILSVPKLRALVNCQLHLCGARLAIVIRDAVSWSRLYICDWKTGQKLFQYQDAWGFAYLSPISFVVLTKQRDHWSSQDMRQGKITLDTVLSLCLFSISSTITLQVVLELLPKTTHKCPKVRFFSEELLADSPDMPHDIPICPFIHDETSERMILIHFWSEERFYFVLTRPLLRLLDRVNQQPSYSFPLLRAWDEWSPGSVYCVQSNDLEIDPSTICGSRVGLLCTSSRLFDGKNEEMNNGWGPTTVRVLDFNPRPLIQSSSISEANEEDASHETVKWFNSMNQVFGRDAQGPPATLRVFGGVAGMADEYLMLDMNHLVVIKGNSCEVQQYL